jgi:hypothetical protein
MRRFRSFLKIIKDIHSLIWTAVGTGLCLITLSGSTRRLGLLITLVGLTLHFVGLLLPEDKDSSDEKDFL